MQRQFFGGGEVTPGYWSDSSVAPVDYPASFSVYLPRLSVFLALDTYTTSRLAECSITADLGSIAVSSFAGCCSTLTTSQYLCSPPQYDAFLVCFGRSVLFPPGTSHPRTTLPRTPLSNPTQVTVMSEGESPRPLGMMRFTMVLVRP
jgi:hypothetical protein